MKRGILFIFFAFKVISLYSSIYYPDFTVRPDLFTRFEAFHSGKVARLGTVYHILQDRTGYMWFGGIRGLGRYDGFNFKIYQNDGNIGALPDREINALVLSPQGDLFVGTRVGICRYDPPTDSFKTIYGTSERIDELNVVDSIYIRALYFSNDSILLFDALNGTMGSVNVRTGESRVLTKHTPVKQHYYYYHALHQMASGDIYFGGRGVGPYQYSLKDSILRLLPVALPERAGFKRETDVSLIIPDSDSAIWIGGLEGLYLYDIKSNMFRKFWEGTVYRMIKDKSNRFWLGTSSGACQIDPASGQVQLYRMNNNDSKSIGGEKIYCVYQDNSGVMWFSHENGISIMQQATEGVSYFFHIPGIAQSPASSRITSIASAGDSAVYLGTRDEGLVIFDYRNLSFRNLNPTTHDQMISRNIRCLIAHPETGHLFLGYWSGRGFGRYKPQSDKFEAYRYRHQDLTQDWYNDFAFRDSNTLLLGFWGGPGLTEFNTTKSRFGKHLNPCFDSNSDVRLMTRLFVDHQERLWIGTNNSGIHRMDLRTGECFAYLTDHNGNRALRNRPVFDITADQTGTIWASGIGLYRYQPSDDDFAAVKLREPYEDIEVYQIAPGSDNTLWMLTENGLLRYHIDNNWLTDYSIMVKLKFKSDLSAFFQLGDDNFLIGGENGLALIDSRKLGLRKSFPRIFLTVLESSNETIIHNLSGYEEIQLPYSRNFFTVKYGIDRLDFHGSYQFFSKLEGFDNDWKSLSRNQGSVSYTNVPSGTYQFKIRAGDIYGNLGEMETTLIIKVLTPWFRQWWFIGGVGLVLLAALVYLWRRRLASLNLSYQNIELNQKLLRLQMNPHFIFNSLTAIQNFIYSHKSREAGEFLSNFARLIRLILDNSRHEFITLEKEIETLNLYMQLQSLRFNNNFDFHIVVDPEIIPEVTRVPPMLAQPFLENAIEHGISKVERRGKIVLRYKQLPQSIRFEITDNGIGLTGSVTDSKQNGIHHESLSISICRERLELLHKRNGTRINFSISELLNGTEVEGTKVVFDIPVHLNN